VIDYKEGDVSVVVLSYDLIIPGLIERSFEQGHLLTALVSW